MSVQRKRVSTPDYIGQELNSLGIGKGDVQKFGDIWEEEDEHQAECWPGILGTQQHLNL